MQNRQGTQCPRRGIRKKDCKQRASTVYDWTVKAVHIWASVRQTTDRRKVGVLHINSTDSKSFMLFLDVLQTKHPDLHDVDLDDPN